MPPKQDKKVSVKPKRINTYNIALKQFNENREKKLGDSYKWLSPKKGTDEYKEVRSMQLKIKEDIQKEKDKIAKSKEKNTVTFQMPEESKIEREKKQTVELKVKKEVKRKEVKLPPSRKVDVMETIPEEKVVNVLASPKMDLKFLMKKKNVPTVKPKLKRESSMVQRDKPNKVLDKLLKTNEVLYQKLLKQKDKEHMLPVIDELRINTVMISKARERVG